jgi:hypothetical protein
MSQRFGLFWELMLMFLALSYSLTPFGIQDPPAAPAMSHVFPDFLNSLWLGTKSISVHVFFDTPYLP